MFFNRMSFSAAAAFCYRFGTGLHAGADILVLLESETRIGSARQQAAVKQLIVGVKKGEQLHVLMGQDQFFPPLMTAMVRVGELTGKLEYLLSLLSEHYQRQQQLRRGFLASIAYPAFLLGSGITVISILIYLMGILTPPGGGQMTDLLGLGLRGGTGVLVFWGYLLFFFAIIGGVTFCFFRNVAGVQNLVPLIYMVPKIGLSIQTITIARFCRALSIALGAGLEPTASIALALDATDSDYYRAVQEDTNESILEGATLSKALEQTGIFPDEFIGKIEIAEHSGTDSESIAFLAAEYDDRAQRAMKVISRTISVLIIISVVFLLLYAMFRIMSVVFGFYEQAFEPI